MSRASNVYAVFETVNTRQWVGGECVFVCELTPLAGFTVKYEMAAWLRENLRMPEDTKVFRMRDGGEGNPVELEWPIDG